jgi:nucleoside-diphosphate-sugar epimerase
MKIETEKVAITGGAGFIGSNLAKRLIDEGKEVLIIDDLSSGSLQNLAYFGIKEVIKGDLRDYEFARRSLKGVQTLYHLAADIGNVVYLHGSNLGEFAAMQSNLIIDANVFRSCVENNIKYVIYPSSVSVYSYKKQHASNAVFKEEDADKDVHPEGGYGWVKYMAEKELALSSLKFGIARIFHAYGPNINISDTKSQVIASLIKKAIKYPKEDFIVWGDGTQKRCFVYIDDVIDALLKLRTYIEKHDNLTINVGSTHEITVEQLANAIIKLSGKDINIKHDTTKPRGANSRMPNLDKANKVLGWKPTTTLNEGLKRTYEWESKRIGFS